MADIVLSRSARARPRRRAPRRRPGRRPAPPRVRRDDAARGRDGVRRRAAASAAASTPTPDAVRVEASLGLAARPFRRLLRREIESELDRFAGVPSRPRRPSPFPPDPMSTTVRRFVLDRLYPTVLDGVPGLGLAARPGRRGPPGRVSVDDQIDHLVRRHIAVSASAGFLSGLGGWITLPVRAPGQHGRGRVGPAPHGGVRRRAGGPRAEPARHARARAELPDRLGPGGPGPRRRAGDARPGRPQAGRARASTWSSRRPSGRPSGAPRRSSRAESSAGCSAASRSSAASSARPRTATSR